jgi:signal peptide peptidase SppA
VDELQLSLPAFARLPDYLGLWCMERTRFEAICQLAKGMDLFAHAAEDPAPLKSAVEKLPATGGKSIAVVRLAGMLMKSQSSMGGTSTVQARRDIRQAAADPEAAGIMLAIDSPGGTVAGTYELARDIKAAAKSKPVWAHIEDLGASAAYWAASQAGRVTANSPIAQVGSIGTYQVIYDESAAAAGQGVKTLVFATGPLKGLGVPGSKITDEQAAHVQALVDDAQTAFDAAVKKGRGMTDKQLAAVRHGGVMLAPAALDAKLIDGIEPLGKALAQFADYLRTGAMPAGANAELFETPGGDGRRAAIPTIKHGGLPVLADSGSRP